jgi:hypothetical protein
MNILAAVHHYLQEHRANYDWQTQTDRHSRNRHPGDAETIVRIASMNARLSLYYIEYFPDRNVIEIVKVPIRDNGEILPDNTSMVDTISLCDLQILEKIDKIIPVVSDDWAVRCLD